MSDLLLHHYDASPFSEKIRLVVGWKRLAWRSVLQPNMMPKPALIPLTGGYRRIPVLQVGADVYCDSQLIAREIERRFPDRTVFPGGSEGLCLALGFWADRMLFPATVPVVFTALGDAVPKAFLEDRSKLLGGADFSAMTKAGATAEQPLRAHAAFLEAGLSDGRRFLLGDQPSLADFAAYHPVWFLRSLPPVAGTLAGFTRLSAWADRVAGIGHGQREACDPAEALRIAREAVPEVWRPTEPLPGDPSPGERVSVTPDDYGFDPVEGELVGSNAAEVAVRREPAEIGPVTVHFPRAGFRVVRL
jgi:glutathione S-transferase